MLNDEKSYINKIKLSCLLTIFIHSVATLKSDQTGPESDYRFGSELDKTLTQIQEKLAVFVFQAPVQ